MIPKILHYCWFGNSPKPKTVLKCLDSWKKFCPGWEIIEWNDDNFDVQKNSYCRQAYKNTKWAFVSDYARFDILNQMGGVYMDTDVEVIKSLEPLLTHQAFAGHETDEWVAPGLILGCEPEHLLIQGVLAKYNNAAFLNEDGAENHMTVGEYFTAALKENGIIPNGSFQEKNNIAIYPKDFFCPLNDATGILRKTKNTYTIHWYSKTWIDPVTRFRTKITRPLHLVFGNDCFAWLKRDTK